MPISRALRATRACSITSRNARRRRKIVIGDARLTLADAPDGSLRRAVRRCVHRRGHPDPSADARGAGALFPQAQAERRSWRCTCPTAISSCRPVVAGIAEANGAIVRVYDGGDIEEDVDEHRWIPTIAVVARNEADFGMLAKSEILADPRTRPAPAGMDRRLFQHRRRADPSNSRKATVGRR